VVAERIYWIREMVHRISELPMEEYSAFTSDSRNVAAAESYLRRGLEALLDRGRHILAKVFGYAAAEYKEIPKALERNSVITSGEANLMRELAGYRNRMVHFYHEISDHELYSICSRCLHDLETLLNAMARWIKDHPDKIDHTL
jgi:uncharacterized protein YutE (UPF0331/DUF86 family)